MFPLVDSPPIGRHRPSFRHGAGRQNRSRRALLMTRLAPPRPSRKSTPKAAPETNQEPARFTQALAKSRYPDAPFEARLGRPSPAPTPPARQAPSAPTDMGLAEAFKSSRFLNIPN